MSDHDQGTELATYHTNENHQQSHENQPTLEKRSPSPVVKDAVDEVIRDVVDGAVRRMSNEKMVYKETTDTDIETRTTAEPAPHLPHGHNSPASDITPINQHNNSNNNMSHNDDYTNNHIDYTARTFGGLRAEKSFHEPEQGLDPLPDLPSDPKERIKVLKRKSTRSLSAWRELQKVTNEEEYKKLAEYLHPTALAKIKEEDNAKIEKELLKRQSNESAPAWAELQRRELAKDHDKLTQFYGENTARRMEEEDHQNLTTQIKRRESSNMNSFSRKIKTQSSRFLSFKMSD